MAHSNRKKLKASRGGLTRNQQRKAQQSARSSGTNRLQETINWLNRLEESKRTKPNTQAEIKIVKYPKDKRTIQRRVRVINRLEALLAKDYSVKFDKTIHPDGYLLSMDRMKGELRTLKSRI